MTSAIIEGHNISLIPNKGLSCEIRQDHGKIKIE